MIAIAASPNATLEALSVGCGIAVRRKALEGLIEDEDLGPTVPDHLLPRVEAIAPIHVGQRAAEPIYGSLSWIAYQGDRVTLHKLSQCLGCLLRCAFVTFRRVDADEPN